MRSCVLSIFNMSAKPSMTAFSICVSLAPRAERLNEPCNKATGFVSVCVVVVELADVELDVVDETEVVVVVVVELVVEVVVVVVDDDVLVVVVVLETVVVEVVVVVDEAVEVVVEILRISVNVGVAISRRLTVASTCVTRALSAELKLVKKAASCASKVAGVKLVPPIT